MRSTAYRRIRPLYARPTDSACRCARIGRLHSISRQLGNMILSSLWNQVTLAGSKRWLARVADSIVLLGMWLPTPHPYLFDPFGMRDTDFDRCFGLIHESTSRLIRAFGGGGRNR